VAAIERFEELLRRYPDDGRRDEVHYDLADSHRRRALELREQAVPTRLRATHEAAIRGHLEAALAAYEAAARGGGASLDAELPRIAMVYQADCLFELDRYAEAAERYERAALRYRDHASSVHALVQIVNCHDRLGDRVRAEIAHRAAIERLRELPDDAFDDPAVVMDRTAWERWLRARPIELAHTVEGADP
jgi:tetratricopeptide (TPR) repeat protein